ncbi:unnamed protein product [Heligmosomoides polygyrus]|uniref:Amiloride-sensitive sodium channel subunit alpha n=1 Tax=Heligmosomoides polygyrus TaxID=6339 RepID=A0A3P8C3J4_HELPZ|nr:unnamed protein product [Heligmosomoides polygyrus]
MGFSQILKDFANWSTVCGVPHIANAKTKRWRVFWAAVFICLVIVFVYELYIMMANFLNFPTNANTEIYFEEQVCPVYTQCLGKRDRNEAGSITSSEKSPVTAVASADKMGSVYDRDQRAAEALALEAARLGDSGLAPALYTYDELITECSFSGKKCSEADFVSFRDPIYGACYSFNEDSSLNYSTNRAGMMFGLKLLLTVNRQLLLKAPFSGAQPYLDNNGINVGVGHQTAISITSTRTHRMKRPYGKCVEKESDSTNLYAVQLACA